MPCLHGKGRRSLARACIVGGKEDCMDDRGEVGFLDRCFSFGVRMSGLETCGNGLA